MLHKKQKFSFQMVRAVYLESGPQNPARSAESQKRPESEKPDLDKLYLDVGERAKLYGRATAILDRAKNVQQPSKELNDKRAQLEKRLNDAKARDVADKNFDVFAHEAIAIHRFADRLEAIMNPPAVADTAQKEV